MHDRYMNAILASIEARISRMERHEWSGGSELDNRLLRRILQLLMERIMPTIDETLAKVTESGDRLDSLLLFVDGLKKSLDEALAGAITPAIQAKIDAIFNEANENVAKTDAALNTNVPPAPVP